MEFTQDASQDTTALILMERCNSLLSDVYSQSELFGKKKADLSVALSYKRNSFWDDVMQISIPLEYFTCVTDRLEPSKDKVSILIGNYEYVLTDYDYYVSRSREKTIEESYVVIEAKVQGRIKTGMILKTGTVPMIKIATDSNNMQNLAAFIALSGNASDILKTFIFDEI